MSTLGMTPLSHLLACLPLCRAGLSHQPGRRKPIEKPIEPFEKAACIQIIVSWLSRFDLANFFISGVGSTALLPLYSTSNLLQYNT